MAGVLLLLNTAARRASLDVTDLPRRHWEDVTMAVGSYLGAAGAQRAELQSPEGGELYKWMRKRISRTAALDQIRPWEVLRTVRKGALPRDVILAPRPSDDTGRAMLVAAGFRLVGGVSPFMVTWVGPLFAVPLFLWVALELAWAGRSVVAGIFLGLCAVSAHVVDVLSLSYSAAGFGTASLLLTVALATYGFLNPAPTSRGLLVRSLLAGALFAICVLCRSGALLTLPGLLVAAAAAASRVARGLSLRLGVLAASAALLAVPYALVRPASHHEAWLGIWEGLGDFDRTKGHTFADSEARKVLAEGGIFIPRNLPLSVRAQETEPFFRGRVLEAVRSDPGWVAKILVRRMFATATQSKLVASRSDAGSSFLPRNHPQQGATDTYYRMTATADVFAMGRHEWEAPLWLLWWPLLALLLAGLGVGLRSAPLRSELAVVATLAVAAMTPPVLVTTAGALETQGFLLVYLLATAFLASRLLGTIRGVFRSGASPLHGGSD